MKVSNINCPGCGANVPINPKKDAAFCVYCGNSFILEKREQTQLGTRSSDFPGSYEKSNRLADQLRLQVLESEISSLESAMDDCLANIKRFKAYASDLGTPSLDITFAINAIGELNAEEIRHAELSISANKVLEEIDEVRSRLGLRSLEQEANNEFGSAGLDFCFHCGVSIGIDDKECNSCKATLV